MGMTANDIARTLIDIQCEIYERHSADSAPTDRAEYDKWVAEATDAVTQLYGNVDMGSHGMEFGKACQMATDMNAHIVAEALERALRPNEDEDWDDEEDEVSQLDEIRDEILNLESERATLSHVVASNIQHVVDVVGKAIVEGGGTLRDDRVDAVSRDALVAQGTVGMKVPDSIEFADGQKMRFSIRHDASGDRDIVSVFWDNTGITLSACSRPLLSMPEHLIREAFA